MSKKKREILIVSIFLIIQIAIYIIYGTQKAYIHMDEAYSLGLASYKQTEIQENDDFYDTWHSKEYYEDYLSVQENEKNDYSPVYENQKNDVHPPLYYLLLRFAMVFSINHYSKWPGIILNIVIYIFITLFMYLILDKLLINENKGKEKAIILAFISSITMASLSTVLYIRMYSLATLNILIIAYLHIKLFEYEKINCKVLILIGISALVGVLTHYYYLFFLITLYIIFAIKYIKKKQFKKLIFYTLTMCIAGIISLIIWPYSIQHMFFGYRGQGAIDNLINISQFLNNIFLYIVKLNCFGFNNLLFPILIMFLILYIYKKIIKKNSLKIEISKYTKILILPTLAYFIIVAIASPWIELRYIMPVSGLIFVLAIYYLYRFLRTMYNEKISNIIIAVILICILIAPIRYHMEPEVLFSDKKEIVEKMGNELNLPTVFFFNANNNRFLDDILLFATVDNSYIAKNIDYTEENIRNILKDKNTQNGIIVFINEGQDIDNILTIEESNEF